MTLHIRVLGSGAGGGSPQWNCNCEICRRVRAGDAPPRTQTSIAVSADGNRWAVVNAPPDLREQIRNTPSLHPRQPKRHSPIDAVALTGAEVDQAAGLLHLREGEPFGLYASGAVHDTLADSAIFDVLDESTVPRRRLPLDETTELSGADGEPLGVGVEPFAVPGKIPLYRETPGETPDLAETGENNVALRIGDGDSHFLFIPCIARLTDSVLERIDQTPLLFVDGTLWHDDELRDADLSEKTGRRMGHVSISGSDGVIERLADVDVERRLLIHINNSNPVLVEDTDERRAVEEAGWEVAYDGMEIEL